MQIIWNVYTDSIRFYLAKQFLLGDSISDTFDER